MKVVMEMDIRYRPYTAENVALGKVLFQWVDNIIFLADVHNPTLSGI